MYAYGNNNIEINIVQILQKPSGSSKHKQSFFWGLLDRCAKSNRKKNKREESEQRFPRVSAACYSLRKWIWFLAIMTCRYHPNAVVVVVVCTAACFDDNHFNWINSLTSFFCFSFLNVSIATSIALQCSMLGCARQTSIKLTDCYNVDIYWFIVGWSLPPRHTYEYESMHKA